MEVPMLKTKRRSLQFDSLEGKILLSTGIADPAATVKRDVIKRFLLNGALYGIPTGSTGPEGYNVSSFSVGGHTASMGNVNGSFNLANTFVPIGTRPDLGNASLTLTNGKGSVQLAIAPSKTKLYHFTIISGTNHYAAATGSGTLTISPTQGSINFVVMVHSK
jgi:hypothetical protein